MCSIALTYLTIISPHLHKLRNAHLLAEPPRKEAIEKTSEVSAEESNDNAETIHPVNGDDDFDENPDQPVEKDD